MRLQGSCPGRGYSWPRSEPATGNIMLLLAFLQAFCMLLERCRVVLPPLQAAAGWVSGGTPD